MKFNFIIILYIYSPVLLLLSISILKDRFAREDKPFRLQSWSLLPGIVVVGVFVSAFVVQSLWKWIPVLKNFEYNPFNWEIYCVIHACIIFACISLILRHIYNLSIVQAFALKAKYLPFILKLCAVLTVINIFGVYILGFSLLPQVQPDQAAIIKAMGIKYLAIYFFNTVILDPILEESVFRGLLYGPLYRKVGKWLGIVLCSLIGTIVHFHYQGILPYVGAFLKGLIAGWLFSRSGSLLHPMIFHMFLNVWTIPF
ncbi:MAG: hypothetical protein A2W09_04055 [Deltaproteobacteria bacterium RBG_16_50_11]|nr:MAG: hypothetical protein A2W09_04055 [Deltaproteobacteria bacterium RBG_16_50_11]